MKTLFFMGRNENTKSGVSWKIWKIQRKGKRVLTKWGPARLVGRKVIDRTLTRSFRANQLRLWLASFAYVLIEALRRLGLAATAFATATAGSIRLKLLKIGALLTVSVRRVKLAMSAAHPHQREFIAAFHALGAAAR